MTEEQIVYQRLGLRVQTLTAPLREAMGLPEGVTGVTISELRDGSELADLGVGRGDIVMGINGRRVSRLAELSDTLAGNPAGGRVQLDLLMTRPVFGELLVKRVTARVALN
jgi:S1-C subfamily serine protease